MTRPESSRFKLTWVALLINGIAILAFGLIIAALDGTSAPYTRAIGAATIGMGLFGSLISVTAYRRREKWAWFCLCYYPVFWTAHLVADLPPGQDHIHQVVFIVVSAAGLLAAIPDFFPRSTRPN